MGAHDHIIRAQDVPRWQRQPAHGLVGDILHTNIFIVSMGGVDVLIRSLLGFIYPHDRQAPRTIAMIWLASSVLAFCCICGRYCACICFAGPSRFWKESRRVQVAQFLFEDGAYWRNSLRSGWRGNRSLRRRRRRNRPAPWQRSPGLCFMALA